MTKTILSTWPLFFGISMIMMGAGLQGTLLGVRASLEHFSPSMIGVIMSMYYVGFLGGSHFAPTLIKTVGHIRVFTAMTALASVMVLLHGVFVYEPVWLFARALTGFSYATLYIVIESWLNGAIDNKSRGKMMATYLVILYGSMAMGQYFLNLANPAGTELFITVAILITLAVLPITLSSRPAPKFDKTEKVSLKYLFHTSPLGVYALFFSGMASASLFSMSPVYASEQGFTLPQISTFMAITILGGVAMQFPIGYLSDRFDRRRVLIGASLASAFFCFLAIPMSGLSLPILFLSMFLIGGTSLTIYGLASAHTNDHLSGEQMVAASASMILVNGLGAIAGPSLSASLMDIFGQHLLFVFMGVIYASIGLYGLYRTSRRGPVPLEEQSPFVAQPSPLSPLSPLTLQVAEEQSNAMLNPMENRRAN